MFQIIENSFSNFRVVAVWPQGLGGMQNIEAAGGSQSGTASQLGGILRDARLD
jgi:hypothetical protein